LKKNKDPNNEMKKWDPATMKKKDIARITTKHDNKNAITKKTKQWQKYNNATTAT